LGAFFLVYGNCLGALAGGSIGWLVNRILGNSDSWQISTLGAMSGRGDIPSIPADCTARDGEPISEAEALRRLRLADDPSAQYYAAWWLGRNRSVHPEIGRAHV
jgi:hypothetical protein